MDPTLVSAYDFSIKSLFKQGWEKVHGFKATLWGALFIYIVASLILFGISKVILMAFHQPETGDSNFLKNLLEVIRFLILYPMIVGLFMLGVKRGMDQSIRAKMVFDYYRDWIRLDGVFIVMYLIVFVISFIAAFALIMARNFDLTFIFRVLLYLVGVVFTLGGIYLLVAYSFAPFLVADKQLGIWEALETSRKAITQHWFKIFFLALLMLVVMVVSAIPLLLGLIWTIPLGYCLWGILYRIIFPAAA